jgi:hypothetical protein
MDGRDKWRIKQLTSPHGCLAHSVLQDVLVNFLGPLKGYGVIDFFPMHTIQIVLEITAILVSNSRRGPGELAYDD